MKLCKLIFVAMMMAINSLSSNAVTLHTDAGRLAMLITEEMRSETSLTITGTMDARDFAILAEAFPELTHLDISQVSIVDYSSTSSIIAGQIRHPADALPPQAFFGMKVREVRLPAELKSIGKGAFVATHIQAIELPESLTTIGDYAFYDCDRLQQITLPTAVASLGDYAFADCQQLTSVDISQTQIDSLPAYAFTGCLSLCSIALPYQLRQIGSAAFAKTGITSISLPTTMERIGDYAFADCKALQSVIVEAECIAMGDGAFMECRNLTDIDLKTDNLPDYAFTGDTQLRFADDTLEGISHIGDYALMNNRSYRLTLDRSLESIGIGAMEGMASLGVIDVSRLGDYVPQMGQDVFQGIDQPNVKLVVADNSVATWKAAEQWCKFNIVDVTSVVKIDTDKESAKAWFEHSVLHIEASNPITRLSIATTDGLQVALQRPHSCHATYDTDNLNQKIYIVVVTTDNEVTSFKLIR